MIEKTVHLFKSALWESFCLPKFLSVFKYFYKAHGIFRKSSPVFLFPKMGNSTLLTLPFSLGATLIDKISGVWLSDEIGEEFEILEKLNFITISYKILTLLLVMGQNGQKLKF